MSSRRYRQVPCDCSGWANRPAWQHDPGCPRHRPRRELRSGWAVLRRGRPFGRWRDLYRGDDERRARAVFRRAGARLVIGKLLLCFDGRIREEWGPWSRHYYRP